jgi:hypothetical protein
MFNTTLSFRFVLGMLVGIVLSASVVGESLEGGDSDNDTTRSALVAFALEHVCSQAEAEIWSDVIQRQGFVPTAYYIVYDLTGDGREDVLTSANFLENGKAGNIWTLITWGGDKPELLMESVSFPAESARLVHSEMFGGPVIVCALTGGGGTGVIMAFSFAGGKLSTYTIAKYSNLMDTDIWPELLLDSHPVMEAPCEGIGPPNSEGAEHSSSTSKEKGVSEIQCLEAHCQEELHALEELLAAVHPVFNLPSRDEEEVIEVSIFDDILSFARGAKCDRARMLGILYVGLSCVYLNLPMMSISFPDGEALIVEAAAIGGRHPEAMLIEARLHYKRKVEQACTSLQRNIAYKSLFETVIPIGAAIDSDPCVSHLFHTFLALLQV